MSDGNLSGHLSKLEEAGLVQIEKQFIEKKPNTQVKITSQGSEEIRQYWEQLEKLKTETKNWKE